MKETVNIQVSGIVQGVGFRPFVFSQAKKLNLFGWVRNTSSGVEIEIQGNSDDIQNFLYVLKNDAPLLAKIDEFKTKTVNYSPYEKFEIIESLPQTG